MRGRRLLAGYLAVVAGLTVLSYAFPAWLLGWRTALGVAGAAAVTTGVARHRPSRRLPWILLAAALLAFTAGEASWRLAAGFDPPTPSPRDPSWSDAWFLAVFSPLAAAALLGLARTGAAGRDRDSLFDVLILTAAAGLLAWTFLIEPFADLPGLSMGERAVGVAYPVFGVLVLAAIARLAAVARRNAAVVMLVVGGLGNLAMGVLYGLENLGAELALDALSGLGWAVFLGGWGAAALHPSMRPLTEPRPVAPGELGPLRLAVLAVTLLLAPAVLAVEAAVGDVPETVVAAGLTAVIFLLTLSRLTGAFAYYRRAAAGERALRRASAALVGATTVDEVSGAAATAVAQLLPPDTPHRVLLARDDDRACAPDPVPAGSVDRDLARRLGNPEAVLCRGLAVQADGRRRIGVLYVGAPREALAALRAPTDVLATGCALALERIRLTAEVGRRVGEEYFRTLVQNASDVILIAEDDHTVRYASPSAYSTLGRDEVIGRSLEDLVHPDDRQALSALLRRVREASGGLAAADLTLVGPFGRRLQAEARCRDLRREPTVAGIVCALRDVTDQRRLEQELTHRAYYDALTGLPNRVLFQERLERALDTARGRDREVGVLLLDLDDFKMINDTLGHAAGDELLVRVGHRLSALLRPEDTAGRLGGDEFGAVINMSRDPEDVERVARRVVSRFADPFELGGVAASGSVTVGVATGGGDATARDLMRQADLALYVAKTSGKGQWRRYRPADHAEVLRRMELRSSLSRAVATGAFELEYQPIVALDTGLAEGMEALVRWRHPVRGRVPPVEFIDVAEESGLIVPIGDWVLAHAVAEAATWSPTDAGTPYLSVNASARQFRQPGFTATVRRILEEAGLPSSRLVIEITESALMRDTVWSELMALRELGVRVAIDDFGTGYSSLSYLRQLPVDIVKLEKSFLTTITSSASQLAVVEGILALADRLGLVVVAEGVERPAVRDQLLRSGCRYGQGFLFARPMPPDEARAWVGGAAEAA